MLVVLLLAFGMLNDVESKTPCLPQRIQMKALDLESTKYMNLDGYQYNMEKYLVVIDYSQQLYAVADNEGNDFVIDIGNMTSYDTDTQGICYSYDVTNELVIPRQQCLPASSKLIGNARIGFGSDTLPVEVWEYYYGKEFTRQRVRLILSAKPGESQYPILFTVHGSVPSHPLGSDALFMDPTTTITRPDILSITNPCPDLPF